MKRFWWNAYAADGSAQWAPGTEFIALALCGLYYRRVIELGFIAPGKSWQNGFAESFHARVRW